jgi:hypothetical protein
LIWSKLASAPVGLSLDAIVDQLQIDFKDVSRQQLVHDVGGFIKQLSQKGFILTGGRRTSEHGKTVRGRLGRAGAKLLRVIVSSLLKLGLNRLAALLMMVMVDLTLKLGGYRELHRIVKDWRPASFPTSGYQTSGYQTSDHPTSCSTAIDGICAAVNSTAVWYLKQALCLQRSAVTACLLRSRGIAAEMVIGCHKMPFCGHAWVEVDGRIVNDTSEIKGFYSVLDRC